MAEATKNPIEKIAEESQQAPPAVKAAVAPKTVRKRRAWHFQLYVVIATLAFGALAFFARFTNYFPLDLQITLAIQSINNFVFDAAMRYLTILLLYVMGLKWEAVMTLFSVVGAGGLGSLIKLIVARPRPDASIVHVFAQIGEFSFPSGHVLFYVSFVGFLWFLCYTVVKRGWRRTLALWLFGLSVALAGVSRVYLGQHWASDVLGSYLLGSVWLALSIAVYRWGKPRFFVTQPVAAEKPNGKANSSSR